MNYHSKRFILRTNKNSKFILAVKRSSVKIATFGPPSLFPLDFPNKNPFLVHFSLSTSFPIFLFSKRKKKAKKKDWGRRGGAIRQPFQFITTLASPQQRELTRRIRLYTSHLRRVEFRDRGCRGQGGSSAISTLPRDRGERGSDFPTLSPWNIEGGPLLSTAAQLLETRRAIKLWGQFVRNYVRRPSRGAERDTREGRGADWWRSTDFAREITLAPSPLYPPLI